MLEPPQQCQVLINDLPEVSTPTLQSVVGGSKVMREIGKDSTRHEKGRSVLKLRLYCDAALFFHQGANVVDHIPDPLGFHSTLFSRHLAFAVLND
jgi:hypothetical protein